MNRDGEGRVELSATDLAHRSACAHLTLLERSHAEGTLKRPVRCDPSLDLLNERGRRHEAAVLEALREVGHEPAILGDFPGSSGEEQCIAAMREGVALISQAPLAGGRWHGRADFLLRVPGRSDLGDWLYEVADAKLNHETRGAALLQLLVYAALVERIQGVPPELVKVVKPGTPPEWEAYRVADHAALFRRLRDALERQIDTAGAEPYPHPVEHCDVCAWWSRCEDRRRDDDHLSLVAGLQALHREELQRQGVDTLEAFAARDSALDDRPARGQRSTYERLHRQARMQLRSRTSGRPEYAFNVTDAGRGFERLPEPSPGDVYFDLEADRFFDQGGLEYLFGFASRTDDGTFDYRGDWALSRAREREAFEAFIDHVIERWERVPDMHIYHFGQYEPAAIRRLTGRHATREAEVDRLLRGGRFVDLHAVVKEAVTAGVERYALKQLEPLFGFTRSVALEDARRGLNAVCRGLELDVPECIDEAVRADVLGYNRDDCLATAALQDWCETRRAEREAQGVDVPRPVHGEGEAPETVSEEEQRIQALFAKLTEGIPEEADERSEEQSARWLLAHCLGYFRREMKGTIWEKYRLMDLDPTELFEERKALVDLVFEERLPPEPRRRVRTDVYRFPAQEAELRPGREVIAVDGQDIGTVVGIDHDTRRVKIRKRRATTDVHPGILLEVEKCLDPKKLREALFELAQAVIDDGVDGEGSHRAARDLLLVRPPRTGSAQGGGKLRADGEGVLDAAKRIARDLVGGVLAIQGPPGAGKSHGGAELIVDLLKRKRRVGVTAVSHAAIDNLLAKVIAEARRQGIDVQAVHKDVDDPERASVDGVEILSNEAGALARLEQGAVVGGTAWFWSSDDAREKLDYLFIDEAGQLSLTYALAVSRAARNLVLLGDPQQLQQPQRAVHPEGADVSVLAHLLAGAATMPEARGLFLEETWRLHPSICELTSELFYDGRLESRAGLEKQAILGAGPIPESGLATLSVPHQGNPSASPEEVDAIASIVTRLLRPGVRFRDSEGIERSLEPRDVMIVAPYNAQVALLQEAVGQVRVGTVDRFQGQDAPVVIYSMAASSLADAPRGAEFLLDPHRFNVATSRARALCILVFSPNLLQTDCGTPRQMRLVNALCRFAELGVEFRQEP